MRGFVGDSYFVSTWLLMLERLMPGAPPAGVVISVPTRHILFAEPLADPSIVRSIGTMVQLAAALHGQGPGSISTDLYWWRPGEPLMLLPSTPGSRGRSGSFSRPQPFVDALESIVDLRDGASLT